MDVLLCIWVDYWYFHGWSRSGNSNYKLFECPRRCWTAAWADTVAPTGCHMCTAMAVPVPDLSGSLPMNLCYHLYEWRSEVKLLSRVWLFVTPWTVAYQAPLAMGFPRQEYRSALPFPSPEDLPDPGIKTTPPGSPALREDSLPLEPSGKSAPLITHFNSFFVISILLKTESDQIFLWLKNCTIEKLLQHNRIQTITGKKTTMRNFSHFF